MTRAEFFDRALLAYASTHDCDGHPLSAYHIANYAECLLARRDEWRRAHGLNTDEPALDAEAKQGGEP